MRDRAAGVLLLDRLVPEELGGSPLGQLRGRLRLQVYPIHSRTSTACGSDYGRLSRIQTSSWLAVSAPRGNKTSNTCYNIHCLLPEVCRRTTIARKRHKG